MSLLEEIQNGAVDSGAGLGALLRRCKILASRLDSKPLEEWLLWESDGYPENTNLPDYRRWALRVKGHFAGPFGASIRNASIPTICIPEKIRESVTSFNCRQSISGLEQMLEQSDGGAVHADLSDLSVLLDGDVYEGYNCLEAWGEFGVGNLVEVINTVRNRILDFALAIEKQYPMAGERSDAKSPIDQTTVSQIFNTTIHGGSMNLIGSMDHSFADMSIQPGDFESIRKELVNIGLPPKEIDGLQDALEADHPPTEPNKFGPKVAAWLGGVAKKAASGILGIGLNVVGGQIPNLISKYYGLAE